MLRPAWPPRKAAAICSPWSSGHPGAWAHVFTHAELLAGKPTASRAAVADGPPQNKVGAVNETLRNQDHLQMRTASFMFQVPAPTISRHGFWHKSSEAHRGFGLPLACQPPGTAAGAQLLLCQAHALKKPLAGRLRSSTQIVELSPRKMGSSGWCKKRNQPVCSPPKWQPNPKSDQSSGTQDVVKKGAIQKTNPYPKTLKTLAPPFHNSQRWICTALAQIMHTSEPLLFRGNPAEMAGFFPSVSRIKPSKQGQTPSKDSHF